MEFWCHEVRKIRFELQIFFSAQVPRKAREKDPAEDDHGAERKVEKVEAKAAKVDCRVFRKWRVSCARRGMEGVRWLEI